MLYCTIRHIKNVYFLAGLEKAALFRTPGSMTALTGHNFHHQSHPNLVWGTPPRIKYPQTRIFTFSELAFTEGIETHNVDDVSVRVYVPEKTLADCFKFRNKIGLDVAVEALRLYRERRRLSVDDIMRFARICRVEKVMRPYLEATL